jgi:hemerythrin
MVLVRWTSSCSVGIEQIDQQHQRLFEIMNGLHRHLAVRKDDVNLQEIARELLTYAESHFGAEKRLMQSAGFPQLAHHLAEHRKFIEQVFALMSRLEEGQRVSAYEINEFLQKWFLNHIKVQDIKYGRFLLALQARSTSRSQE